MRVNESWLREWVKPELSTDELVHQITMAGLEVDAVEPAAAPFTGVVVGEVVETAAHPDAEKLTVCQVTNGAETVQVVCGASNVRAGLKVPFAQVGAVLAEDFRIKKAKLRGEASFGMLCGASELGLEDIVDGLLELPDDAPVGEDIRSYLALDDQVIEVDLTPNRADCLSVRGIAREVGTLNRVPVTEPTIEAVAVSHDQGIEISLNQPEACPRYLGRVIRNIDCSAQTPLWMRERLRRSGIGCIDPVVDVTNYVLLELGQPMHAFDLGKLSGGIQVRLAEQGEKLALLDGQTIELNADNLVIADQDKAVALAGIMGGQDTAVSDTTSDILLECAWFNPLAIAGRARQHGLHTDSSHRFERGVDPELQAQAMERATKLILEIAGGEAGPVVSAESATHLPSRPAVSLDPAKVERLLGLALEAEEIEDSLTRLGMQVSGDADNGWQVQPPSWRFDVSWAEDLVEELARVHGYDRLPTRLPAFQSQPEIVEARLDGRRFADLLQGRGYLEAISYSFVEPSVQSLLEPEQAGLALANPISADLAVMRSTLWAGLLPLARHNLNRQAERLRIFEQGLRFRHEDGQLVQRPALSGLMFGVAQPQHWSDKPRKVDFYDLKGDVEALLDLSAADDWRIEPGAHPALHPGQSAAVYRGGRLAGWLGKLHPVTAKALDVPADIFLFELEMSAIGVGNVPKFGEISTQPRVRRDLAFVLSDTVPASKLLDAVRRACDDHLQDIRIFDVYQGDSIGEGMRSLALGLTFQDQNRTLVEEEINTQIESVVTLLKQEFNANLRD